MSRKYLDNESYEKTPLVEIEASYDVSSSVRLSFFVPTHSLLSDEVKPDYEFWNTPVIVRSRYLSCIDKKMREERISSEWSFFPSFLNARMDYYLKCTHYDLEI